MRGDSDTITAGEAAALLEVTRRRITGMAAAGEIVGAYQDGAGRWRIPRSEVDRLLEERRRDPNEKPGKKPREDPGSPAGELVGEMRARIEDLKEQLEAEREANRENRRIIAGLTQRIPELTAAEPESNSGPREYPESSGPTRTPTAAGGGQDTGSQPRERSLWRRIFGG